MSEEQQETEETEDLLDEVAFAEDNPEPRCPVVLLLDTSSSMSGRPIGELNEGLQAFAEAIKTDKLAALRVEVALITFGGQVQAVDVQGGGGEIPFDAGQAFCTVDRFVPPTLSATGRTPMGEGMRRALELLQGRKDGLKQQALDYYRPWIFLITDGAPNDAGWEEAADQAKVEEERKGVSIYAVGVEGANMEILARFSGERAPLKLKGLAFQELFRWLSASLSSIAHSRPGEQAPLPAVGWSEADTSH
ncbi:MAG: VWA domain-containing protein [Candidatus Latescibacteria bacterium]|nr:VWA domain-containing protein [Candidatus Latescibacterota bacterium]